MLSNDGRNCFPQEISVQYVVKLLLKCLDHSSLQDIRPRRHAEQESGEDSLQCSNVPVLYCML